MNTEAHGFYLPFFMIISDGEDLDGVIEKIRRLKKKTQ